MRARANYGKNAAGKWVRRKAWRECDYTPEGHLHEFDTEDAFLKFEQSRHQQGHYQAHYEKKARDTVPEDQLPLQRAITHAVERTGNMVMVGIEAFEDHMHARFDDMKESTKKSERFFQALGGAGSSTELRVQAKALQVRANEQAKKERAEERAKIKAEGKRIKAAVPKKRKSEPTKDTKGSEEPGPPAKSLNQLKRKRPAELEALCDEFSVELCAKKQMAKYNVEKRAALPQPVDAPPNGNAEETDLEIGLLTPPTDAAPSDAGNAALAPAAGAPGAQHKEPGTQL